jgi:hypothetical protein
MATAAPSLDDDLARQRATLENERAGLLKRQQTMESDRAGALRADDAQAAPIENALQNEMGTPLPTAPTPTDKPSPPDLKVDPKQYEGLAMGMLALAMIGGGASRTHWMGALSSLNGALKGMKEGRDAEAQQQLGDYKRKYQAAYDADAQANKQFQDVLASRKLSMNEKIEQLRLLGAKHDRQDAIRAADLRSIDHSIAQIDAHEASLASVHQRQDAVIVRLEDSREKRAAAGAGGAGGKNAPQTEGGQALAAALLERGVPVSYFGGKGRLYDTMAADKKYAGMDAHEIAGHIVSDKAEMGALSAAFKATELSRAGTERITSSISNIEDKVVELAKQVGLADSTIINTPVNKWRTAFGDAKFAELQPLIFAVSREYARATTAPGSNAMLVQGAQEEATRLLNSGMPIKAIVGAMRGMNEDIAAGKVGAEHIEGDLRGRLQGGHGGAATPPPAPGAAPTVSNW